MRKSIYYIVQIIWSFIVSTVIWYLTIKNLSFDFYGNSDNSLAGMILFFGAAIYLILTIVHICFGVKKVKGWHWWDILVSLVIAGVLAIAGLYGVDFISGFWR